MDLADRLHLEGLRALEAREFDAAVKLLDAAVIANPTVSQAHNNLGLSLRLAGRGADAILAFEKAIHINPLYDDAYFNLGVALLERGASAEAEHRFRAAIQTNPLHLSAHYSLAEIFAGAGRIRDAAFHLGICLDTDPDDCLGASIFLAALNGGPLPPRASNGHLDRLYRQRATLWDHASGYEAHKAVALSLGKLVDVSAVHILDLGCGTGLVGEQIGPRAKSLHGVDRSDEMLRVAAGKNIYQSLYQADVLDFMDRSSSRYDAITAAGLLIHFGDLNPVLRGVANLLTGSGAFVFSVYSNDRYDEGGFSAHPNLGLAKAGCFAHGSAYVAQAAQHAGLRAFEIVPIVHETSMSCSAPGLVVSVMASN